MAAASMGIWNHLTSAGQVSPGATAMDTSTGGTDSSSSSDSATISANDFLSLLVTEMQNQDPTADTDPNEYINQLVNVNSLEQLISINQTLSSATGSSTTPSGGAAGTGATAASTDGTSSLSAATEVSRGAQTGAHGAITHGASLHDAPGNLGIPEGNPAALRVAQSLNGRHPAR